MAINNSIPDSFVAGTTVQYERSYSDYPTSNWNMTLFIAGVAVFSIPATESNNKFLITISANQTKNFPAGNYRWEERVTDGTNVYIAGTGTVVVLADIAQATAGSLLSWEEKTLKVVEDALMGRLSADMESYSIDGRAVSKIPSRELLGIRNSLRRAVNAQKNIGKMGPTVLTVFKPNNDVMP